MKRLVILTVILFLGLLPAWAREYEVSGPEGGLAMKTVCHTFAISRRETQQTPV